MIKSNFNYWDTLSQIEFDCMWLWTIDSN